MENPQVETQSISNPFEPKTVTTLTDLFTAIHGLEKLGMVYSIDSPTDKPNEPRQWIVQVKS